MFLVTVLLIIAAIIVWAESGTGKIVLGCATIAIGALLLYWILDIAILFKIAKICAIIIVVTIALGIFSSIMRS